MTKKMVLPSDVEYELIEIRDIVGLATFATEARRVLADIDQVASQIPAVKAALGCIDARCQWQEYPDTAAAALDNVYDRLGRLIGRT